MIKLNTASREINDATRKIIALQVGVGAVIAAAFFMAKGQGEALSAFYGGVIMDAGSGQLFSEDTTTLAYHIGVIVEEGPELIGVTIALYGAWLFATFREEETAAK